MTPTLALTAAIVVGYAASLWWLLRRERAVTLLLVVVLCSLTLSLRLVFTADYPAGLNEDEVKTLALAIKALRTSKLMEFGQEGPLFLNTLFQAPLVPLLGPGWWAIRVYPIIASVLATAAAFAAGRAMTLRIAPSLAIAALVAALPWSMFYGRISFGGEMTFHQLLLLSALARIVWCDGSWPEVLIGSLGLCLLCYDYTCGLAMLGMPLAAAVLARGWRRVACLAVLVLALAGWAPYPIATLSEWSSQIVDKVPGGFSSAPVETFRLKAMANLHALVWPIARNGWLAIQWAAVHPPAVLVVALLGAFYPLRRALFLWAGFLAALVPSVISEGLAPSSHRMLMAFPFISMAVGNALDLIPWRLPRRAAALLFVAAVTVHSVWLYFSPRFWPPESRWIFDVDRSAVMEAIPLPPHPPAFADPNLGAYAELRIMLDRDLAMLTVESWLPPPQGAAIYAFSAHAAPLRPFYAHLLGDRRVQPAGRGFLVTFEGGDWSWLRQYGWSYQVRCGERTWHGQVPTLFHMYFSFANVFCNEPSTHTWRGHWEGPRTDMQLAFNGAAEVRTSGQVVVQKEGVEARADFVLEPGMDVTVTIVVPAVKPVVGLYELTRAGSRLPAWEQVTPAPAEPVS